MRAIRIIFFLFFLPPFAFFLYPLGKELVNIEGDYLFYSYDYNYIFGKGNIRCTSGDFQIQAQTIEMDINDRNAFLTQGCQVDHKGVTYKGDCLDWDLEKMQLRLFSFEEKTTFITLPDSKEKNVDLKKFEPVSILELKKSFVYFIGKHFVIRKNFSVYGYQITIYVEGMQSVSLKKFRLDKGMKETQKGLFSFDKISYNTTQGMVINPSINFQKKGKKEAFNHATNIETQYDFFGLAKAVPQGRVYVNSISDWTFSPHLGLKGNISWITQNMTHGSLSVQQKIGTFMNNEFLLDYNKPFLRNEELWYRLRSSMPLKSWGNFSFNYSYEKQGQNVWELSYNNQFFKKLNLLLHHNQSKLIFDKNTSNRLANSSFSLSYSTRIFNLSTDYSLNRDLLHDQSQANPTLRLQLIPFKIYGGLIRVNIMSTAMLNYTRKSNISDNIFRSNSTFSLETEKFTLFPKTEFSASLSMEQFLDKDPRNRFTTLGYIFRGKHNLWDVAFLEFLYNYQTRRETGNWFIQGTHSQDMNLIFRLDDKKNARINGWTSISIDTKRAQPTTGFLDLSIFLVKNWRFQTQVNYDFIFKRFHYDFYLIRKAGRIMFRISYRSVSKQFMFDIMPQ